ncbi:MAG: fasciclin domain-containing protein [Flavobacteriales bacterium]|nr:fasciclin domain-containing protein [Flavobacteriales bacterium]
MKKLMFVIALGLFVTSSAYAQCGSHQKTSHIKKASWSHSSDIIDVASGVEDFSTLVAAIKAADLASTLKSDGPFTVFAPLNSAFSKLPEGTVKSLLQPENKDQLISILTYHVVSGEFNAKDVIAAINSSGGEFTVKTVNGDNLTATLVNGSVILTDANGGVAAVTKTDVGASNGVIHIIDSVVLPG